MLATVSLRAINAVSNYSTDNVCVMQLCHKFIRDGFDQFWLHASSLDKMATAGEHRLHTHTHTHGGKRTITIVSCDVTVRSCDYPPAASG